MVPAEKSTHNSNHAVKLLRHLISNRTPVTVAVVLCISFLLVNCTKTNSKGFLTPSINEITLLTAMGKPISKWNKDESGKVYLTSRTLEFTGTCPRDSSLVITLNGVAESKSLTCASTGKFTWTKVLLEDGPLELKIASSKDSSIQVSKKFEIDSIPPSAPIVTTNGGLGFSSPTSSFQIDGSTDADSIRVESDATGTMSLALPLYSFATSLGWAQSRVYSFVAIDFAGNRSTPTTITVQYQLPTELSQSTLSSVGLEDEITGNGGTVLSTVSGEAMGSSTGALLSSGGNITLTLGFSNVGFLPDP